MSSKEYIPKQNRLKNETYGEIHSFNSDMKGYALYSVIMENIFNLQQSFENDDEKINIFKSFELNINEKMKEITNKIVNFLNNKWFEVNKTTIKFVITQENQIYFIGIKALKIRFKDGFC